MKKLPALLASLLVAMSLAHAWTYSSQTAGIDFYQFWAGGRAARTEGAALYSADTAKRLGVEVAARADGPRMGVAADARPELELFSSPLLYACFGVFPADYERAFTLHRALSLACTCVGLLLIGWRVGLAPWKTLLVLSFVMLWFQPLASDARVGNVNQWQLVMIGAAMAAPPIAAGAILGFAVLFKPNVLLMALLMSPRAGARGLGGGAARSGSDSGRAPHLPQGASLALGVTAGFLLGSLWFGTPRAWIAWLDALRHLAAKNYAVTEGNLALFGRFGWIVAIALTAIAVWRKAHPAVGLVIVLLGSTLVWHHYLLLALPAVLILMNDRPALAVLALTLIGGDLWVSLLGIQTHRAEALVANAGLALLFVGVTMRGAPAATQPLRAPTRRGQ